MTDCQKWDSYLDLANSLPLTERFHTSYYFDTTNYNRHLSPISQGRSWGLALHVTGMHQGLAVTQEPQIPMKLRKLSATLLGNRKCRNQATGHSFTERCRMLLAADFIAVNRSLVSLSSRFPTKTVVFSLKVGVSSDLREPEHLT